MTSIGYCSNRQDSGSETVANSTTWYFAVDVVTFLVNRGILFDTEHIHAQNFETSEDGERLANYLYARIMLQLPRLLQRQASSKLPPTTFGLLKMDTKPWELFHVQRHLIKTRRPSPWYRCREGHGQPCLRLPFLSRRLGSLLGVTRWHCILLL